MIFSETLRSQTRMSCEYVSPNLNTVLDLLMINETALRTLNIAQLRRITNERTQHLSYPCSVSIMRVLRVERRRMKKKGYTTKDDDIITEFGSEITSLEKIRDELFDEKKKLETEINFYLQAMDS